MERHESRGPRRRSRSRDRDHSPRHRDRDHRDAPRDNRDNRDRRDNRDKRDIRDNRDNRDHRDRSRNRDNRDHRPSGGRDRERGRQNQGGPRRGGGGGNGGGGRDALFVQNGRKKGEKFAGDGKKDEKLPEKKDDPREGEVIYRNKGGRNTESFDPASTFVRPAMRLICGPANVEHYPKPCKHDDVIVVPNFGCEEDDWSTYYKLVEEMRSLQEEGQKRSEWIAWHEGCHLISQNPKNCPTYEAILKKMCDYFKIDPKSAGTRFNWYRDSSDWKPFHNDSAAYNPQRAKNQNVTVGISFGAERELAFLHGKNGTRLYFPQTNGMLFHFGRDVNINWKHGVNALPKEEHSGKGRISIILWGLVKDCVDERGSPGLLTNDARNGFDNGRRDDDRRQKPLTTDQAIHALEDAVRSGQHLGRRHRELLAKLTGGSADNSSPQKKSKQKSDACFSCGKDGHKKRDCKDKEEKDKDKEGKEKEKESSKVEEVVMTEEKPAEPVNAEKDAKEEKDTKEVAEVKDEKETKEVNPEKETSVVKDEKEDTDKKDE